MEEAREEILSAARRSQDALVTRQGQAPAMGREEHRHPSAAVSTGTQDRSSTMTFMFWADVSYTAVFLPDELDCQLVYSGVCERHALSVHLCSVWCQISDKTPTKTHRAIQKKALNNEFI